MLLCQILNGDLSTFLKANGRPAKGVKAELLAGVRSVLADQGKLKN
jgi:hypothetical protein